MLDIIPYKTGYFRLRSVEDLFTLLEDNQVLLSSMKASRFVKPFESQVDKWERMLSLIMETIEGILAVQKQWMYLENIFVGSEDIRKQLPNETLMFDDVNNQWSSLMGRSECESELDSFSPCK